MGMVMPIGGVIIALCIVGIVCAILFPSLPFFYDKTKDHFDLKDEDYEDDVKEEYTTNESKG